MSASWSPRTADEPAVDERGVAPETRYELVDGRLVHVSPADAPHAVRHAQIVQLIGAHMGLEFEVACDMLTRTTRVDDFAPDVSVFPAGRDPETGGRQLEQLAFEVVSTESLGHAGGKASKLMARGVRRVFAIDVEGSRVLEWSMSGARWAEVEAACIEDAVLDVPLPVEVLVRTVKADDAIARALWPSITRCWRPRGLTIVPRDIPRGASRASARR
jgi:Uma2 family endonuclease